MKSKKILTYTLASTVLMSPMMTLADSGADHAHTETQAAGHAHDGTESPGHHAGESSLVLPGTTAWWGLIAISLALMIGLSLWVYKYIQVAPVMKKQSGEGM